MKYRGRQLTLARLAQGLKRRIRRVGEKFSAADVLQLIRSSARDTKEWIQTSDFLERERDPRFASTPSSFPQQSSFVWILNVLFSDTSSSARVLDISAIGESASFSTKFLANKFGASQVDCICLDAHPHVDARSELSPSVNVLSQSLNTFEANEAYNVISVLGRSASWRTVFQKFFQLEKLLADDGYLIFSIATDIQAATKNAGKSDDLVREFVRRFGSSRLSLNRLQRDLAFSPFHPIAMIPIVTSRSAGRSAAWVVAKKSEDFLKFRKAAPELLHCLIVGDWAAAASLLVLDGRETPLLAEFRERLKPYASKFAEAAKNLEAEGKRQEARPCKYTSYYLDADNSDAAAELIGMLRTQGNVSGARELLLSCQKRFGRSAPLNREALLLHLADGGKTSSSLAEASPAGIHAIENVRGLSQALAGSEWLSAALLLRPAFETDMRLGDRLGSVLAPFAPIFSALAKLRVSAGDAEGGTACMLAAWSLVPDNLTYAIELIARLRVDRNLTVAEMVLRDARHRFTDHPNILLQSALVAASRGRGLEATQDLWAYTKIYPKFGASQRRSMMSVLRDFVRECQSAGITNDFPHPLLAPEIFDAYRNELEANTSRWFDAPFAQIFEDEARERRKTRLAARASQQVPSSDRPLRILFITSGNWAFLLNLFRYLEAEETDIQFRTFDFSMTEEIIKKEHAHELYAPVRFGLDPAGVWNRVHDMDATFSELVEWADVVVCEWATAHAVWLSRFLPPHKRLVIRLHSYEAFTQWPFFMNFGGVDGLIFVADHIKRFSDLQFRWSRFPLRHEVLSNFNFLENFARTKSPKAKRTLAMVGYSNLNKDPLMAARVLAKLRESDPAWRLMLVGHPWNSAVLKGKELEYFQRFEAFVADNGLAHSIVYRGFTRNIPEVMRDVGVILSCSWREGTHESILEGMASGAIPVVRKWPMVHQFGAPETVYPDLEYYDSPEEAAEIILKYAEPALFERRSAEAMQYALERFDIRAVYPAFKRIIQDYSQIP